MYGNTLEDIKNMEHIIFNIIIAILIFDFIFGHFLKYLNTTRWSKVLPKELEGIYDAEKYAKQQDYQKVNYKFSIITSSFSFVLILLMFYLEGFAFIDQIARTFSENIIIIALIFFGILMFASDILNTPFSIYDTFVIEEKFGFNKTTPKTFFFDKLKAWLISALLGGGILSIIIWFYIKTGTNFWIYGWLIVAVFTIFMAMFYSNLIVPLFNKQTPLEEGDLRNEIEEFSQEAGFKLNNIFVIDGSKRSTKANAYFTGLGTKKRIVLYDTLIDDLKNNEIVAVLAHEIGHYKKKHTTVGIIVSLVHTAVLFYLISLFINNPAFSKALSVDTPSFHIGLITFGILYSPISTILGIIMNFVSRKNEYQADHFAGSFNLGDALIEALKKLSINNLSNLTPHPLFVFINYSHPTLLQRIAALRKKKQ